MICKFLAFVTAALLLCGSASASVLYRWVPDPSNAAGYPLDIDIRIVVSDAAVEAGSVGYHRQSCIPGACVAQPLSPVLSLYFSVGGGRIINLQPSGERFDYGQVDINIGFNGNFFGGSVYAHDQSTNFRMVSNGNLFSFLSMDSDQGIPGPGNMPWQGVVPTATGYMQRVDAANAPEPSTFALLAIGLLAFAPRGRRERPT